MVDGPAPSPDDGTGDAQARRVADHLFSISPVLKHWGVELIEARRGAVRLAMTVREDMANTLGTCHGGIIYTLTDSCFGYTANVSNDRAAAVACEIRFLKPARIGDRITAQSQEIWKQGRGGLYDVTITNQDGDIVAVARGQMRNIGGHHIEAEQPLSGL